MRPVVVWGWGPGLRRVSGWRGETGPRDDARGCVGVGGRAGLNRIGLRMESRNDSILRPYHPSDRVSAPKDGVSDFLPNLGDGVGWVMESKDGVSRKNTKNLNRLGFEDGVDTITQRMESRPQVMESSG